jgi:4-hydroxy-tetrahydrodipicolinate reductase
MNIALIGYGKMGHAIERIALQRGHQIVLKISSENQQELTLENLRKADVAIEFTRPDAAAGNVKCCIDAGIPVVSGTTGWNDALAEQKEYCGSKGGALLHASNFSVGVQIFFELNRKLAALMNSRPEYDVKLEEIHHTEKKDAPSGTAITLAEEVVTQLDRKSRWELGGSEEREVVGVVAHRQASVPGTHKVCFYSAIDDIEISHVAHNRDGFAIGAVIAAEFLKGKTGIFSMKEVLGL